MDRRAPGTLADNVSERDHERDHEERLEKDSDVMDCDQTPAGMLVAPRDHRDQVHPEEAIGDETDHAARDRRPACGAIRCRSRLFGS
jgi:hypothetical protein